HLHQHQPPGADFAAGDQAARRGAPGLGVDPGDRPAHRLAMGLPGCVGSVRRDGKDDALARQHHLGAAGAGGRPDPSIRSAPHRPATDLLPPTRPPRAPAGAKIVPADLLPPDELPDAEYPLVLTTGRLLEHWHTGSMTRRAANLDTLEPEAIAGLNPREMERLSVPPGGLIRVSTRRGEVVLKARADRDVAEGMVFIPFCFAEAAANLLTNPQLDPMGKIPEFKFCACKVEQAEMMAAAK